MRNLLALLFVILLVACGNPTSGNLPNSHSAIIIGTANNAVARNNAYIVTVTDVDVIEIGSDAPDISDKVDIHILNVSNRPFSLLKDYEFHIEHSGNWIFIKHVEIN